MRSLPPLTPLPAFCAAARLESFTAAAMELSLTHGAISRAVKQLENHYGVALFQRRNRRIFLTDKGRLLAEHAGAMLNELGRVDELMRASDGDARLTVSCEPSLAMRWLMPRLGEFTAGPDRGDVHLSTAGGPVDLIAQGLDLAIRRSDFKWHQDYWVTPIGKESIGLVCHPDYWDGQLKRSVTLLHSRTRPQAWEDWLALNDLVMSVDTEHYFDHFYFSLQAAVAGLGVAIGPRALVLDDLARGHLIAPFGFVKTEIDYKVLSLSNPKRDPRLGEFIDWLVSRLSQDL